MALATYSDLLAQLPKWLGRSDTDTTDQFPDFITLFEAAAARKLKVRPMEATTTLTPSAGSVALPAAYLGYRTLTWTGSPNVVLEYVHPSFLTGYYPTSTSDIPKVFSIVASNIVVRPLDNTDLSLDYWAKTAALSSALGWLYTNHPDAYLFGTLAEAYLFNKDADNAGIWKARRDQVFDEISLLNFRENAGLQIRSFGQTP